MSDLVLRVCAADGASYGGFVWPLEVGATVTAPDWEPTARCGKGLHGWLHGRGDHGAAIINPDSVWLVVEPIGPVVDLDAKVKFESCVIRFVGTKHEAAQYVLDNDPEAAMGDVIGLARSGSRVAVAALGTATAGYGGMATAGNGGMATAGNGGTATAGARGTATAGIGGTATAGNGGTATAGNGGTATADNWGTATAGNGGTATAGNGGTATAGNGGTAMAGIGGTAMAGDLGIIQIKYYDGVRYRIAIGYVGEDGIEPNVPYVVKDGKLTKKG